MVILIGGVSCTGKTVMAQKLLEKYKIPYLSIDHVKMGLIRGSKYCDFSATDGDDELTNKLWPIVKGIIMTNIENGQHIIIGKRKKISAYIFKYFFGKLNPVEGL
jgi:hypothetical protein